VPVPVADVAAAKEFYAERLGFAVDHDIETPDGSRIVQLTPPGSACSILLSKGLPGLEQAPGVVRGLHLVVDDVRRAREVLLKRGVEAGEVLDMGGILYVPLADPDGNSWMLQEIPPSTRTSSEPQDVPAT
jgi:catechol 2,3-dioxygenase-like lactoylglutathione lyase family enzyme